MYSREEAAKLRQQFWIAFGKYMKPIPSAEGLPINWINYKTGVKNISFKMNAEQRQAFIAIELTQGDEESRNRVMEQFKALKTLFTDAVKEEWVWEENTVNDFGVTTSRIYQTLNDVNVYDPKNWPALISFLKPRLIALDQFWVEVKAIFEEL